MRIPLVWSHSNVTLEPEDEIIKTFAVRAAPTKLPATVLLRTNGNPVKTGSPAVRFAAKKNTKNSAPCPVATSYEKGNEIVPLVNSSVRVPFTNEPLTDVTFTVKSSRVDDKMEEVTFPETEYFAQSPGLTPGRYWICTV